MNNLAYYLLVSCILLAVEFSYIVVAKKTRIVDKPHYQSSHRGIVVRGGGVIFYVAYFLWCVVNDYPAIFRLYGLSILVMVSLIDDIRGVPPKVRLLCHFVAIFLLFYHSGLIRMAPHVIVILFIACVGALNIFNFMDGVNGMTGGYSLVVSLAMLYVNEYVVNFTLSSLLIFIIIAILIFNFFNFRFRAVCFAGDVGALSIGFILVCLLLRLILSSQSMSWIAMMIVYGVDGGLTILHRILLKENLMKPHKKHVYQIMANELKMPHLAVTGIYMGLQAVCCAWYLVCPGYLTLFLETGILVTMYLLFMKKYFYLHVKN